MVRSMDRTEVEQATGAGAGKKTARKGRRKRLAVLGSLVLVVVAGGVAWTLLGGGTEEEEAEEVGEVEEVEPTGPVVEVSELTANVGGEGLHYARLSMAAVLSETADVGLVEQRFPILKDAAITELSRMDPVELRSTAGLERLRELMTAHAHRAYPDGEVRRILITELVVQ